MSMMGQLAALDRYNPDADFAFDAENPSGPAPTPAQRLATIDPLTGNPINGTAEDLGRFGSILQSLVPRQYGDALAGRTQVQPEIPGKITEGDVFRADMQARQNALSGAQDALGLLGIGAPNAMTGSAGIFGGKLAQTADLGALKDARTMQRAGVEPGAILDTTGWEKRPDRQWRYEINDRDSVFDPNAFRNARTEGKITTNTDLTLSEVFRHPELYAAYPHFGDMPVRKLRAVDEFGRVNETRGAYDPNERAFYLRENLTPEEARSSLLHEIQHGVQHEERFGSGGSPYEQAVSDRADKMLAQNISDAQARFEMLRDRMINEIAASTSGGNVTRPQIEAWKKANPELSKQMDDAFDIFSAPGGALRKQVQYNTYRSLQGEAEARNVSKRADLIPEQRYLLRPEVTEDIPRSAQWTRVDKKPSVMMGDIVDPSTYGRARDPRMWSLISKQKLSKPLDEMAHQYTDVRTPVPKFVTPEELIGSYGIFTPWDLSAANKTLTHVDDVKLQQPVRLHGGVGFPEANPGMAAASDLAISRRLDNQAARLQEETGKPVTIWPMTMSPRAIDASHHVADPLAQLVQNAPITRKDAAAFDKMMREQVADWVGIKKPGFRDYINGLQGGMTTKALMADRMAMAEWQAKGFPDVAAVRHAASEPSLIEMPRNTVGMAISQYIPGQGLLETTHPSYPKGVAGNYMGQLASLIPFEAAAPDIAKGLADLNARNMAAGKKTMIQPAYHMGKPTAGVPTAQFFDEPWAENIRKLWGDIK